MVLHDEQGRTQGDVTDLYRTLKRRTYKILEEYVQDLRQVVHFLKDVQDLKEAGVHDQEDVQDQKEESVHNL